MMKKISLLIIFMLVSLHQNVGHIVKGVKSVSILFTSQRWLQPAKKKYALQDVTADFSSEITAFCGPSGSGKSTLAKLIHGQFLEEDYEGIVDSTGLVSNIPTVYLDPLFYLTYDSSRTVGHYLMVGILAEEKSVLFRNLQTSFDVPNEKVINNLLESQKKFFEILLCFSRIDALPNDSRGLLILDEYLDRDMPSVRTIFFQKIRELFNNTNITFQVIIISHSKGVCNCCDAVVALKNGFVYSNGSPHKVMKYLPPEFVILQ